MEIKFWGVRGSLATPLDPGEVEWKVRKSIETYINSHGADLSQLESFVAQNPLLTKSYGGHTSCVELTSSQGGRLVIDAGSGIKKLGDELITSEFGKGQGHLKLLMTHFHWDHLVGLPFFSPLYIKGNKIEVYSPDPFAEEAFKTVFKKPFFPLPFDTLAADIEFHLLPPRVSTSVGDFNVEPYLLDHPDPCWGYRITSGERTLCYAVDTEAQRRTPEELGEDLPLYQGADLMVFDAQYTLSELGEKQNWGHSAAPRGLEMARSYGIPRVAFVHHDPSALDEDIQKSHAEAEQASEGALPKWHFVREGETLKI